MAGTITGFKSQKRAKMRVNVYLDEQFAFGLAVIHATQLQVGQWLSDEAIAALQSADEVERAREYALNYLSYRPRSVAEMQRHLLKHGFGADAVTTVLQGLQRVGLVDDVAFAQYWVDNRARFRPRGRRALVQELMQKGISAQTIEIALAEYDETVAAQQVAEEQGRRLAHLPPDMFRRRLTQRLARRGFSYALIQEVLSTYTFPDSGDDF